MLSRVRLGAVCFRPIPWMLRQDHRVPASWSYVVQEVCLCSISLSTLDTSHALRLCSSARLYGCARLCGCLSLCILSRCFPVTLRQTLSAFTCTHRVGNLTSASTSCLAPCPSLSLYPSAYLVWHCLGLCRSLCTARRLLYSVWCMDNVLGMAAVPRARVGRWAPVWLAYVNVY